jgi:hypothetical protein
MLAVRKFQEIYYIITVVRVDAAKVQGLDRQMHSRKELAEFKTPRYRGAAHLPYHRQYSSMHP